MIIPPRSSNTTKWVFAVLLGIGVGVGAFYMWYRFQASSLDGYYIETDGFTDVKGNDLASVHFIQVEAYDSIKSVLVANEVIQNSTIHTSLDVSKKRRFLFHFYTATDTAALTKDMIDELAYTSPTITDAPSTLLVITNGYVVQEIFEPNMKVPKLVECQRTQFYMPRPGIKAQSVK